MKKAMILFLILSMAFILVACGGTSTSDTPPASTPPSTPSTSTPSTTTPATPATPAAPSTPAETQGPKYGGTFRQVAAGTLDVPFGVVWHYWTAFRPSHAFVEALLNETPRGEMTNNLCTSWTPDRENNELRFTLREDVFFPDGTQFNAEVVAWHVYQWIENGMLDPTILGAEARSEFEVAILMSEYGNWAPNFFASRVTGYISMENYVKNGSDYAEQHPMGTGPFVLKEWVPGISMVWEKRDDYWQPGKPYLDALEYVAMTDVMTQTAAMISGDIDFLQTGIGEQVATIRDAADVSVFTRPAGALALMPSSLNPDSPLAIQEVREAIFYAIDREAICDARGFGMWTPSTQIIMDTFQGHLPPSAEPSFDPARAKELLTKAGYPNGLTITLYSPSNVDRDAMVAVQNMLGEVGINIDLEFPESGYALDLRTNGWEGLYATSIAQLSNITSTLSMYFDPTYFYYPTMWRPAELEPLFYELRSTALVEDNLMQQFCQALDDIKACIPIYDTYLAYIVRNGFEDTGFGAYGAGTEWLPPDTWYSK